MFNFEKVPSEIMPNILKQKLSRKKLKEKGFENFDDFKIENITIEKISKKNDTFGFGYMGENPILKTIVEEMQGTIVLESPLIGDKPTKMIWKADIELNKTKNNFSFSNSHFYWGFSENPDEMFCLSQKNPYIPSRINQRGKLFGLNKVRSISHQTGPDYLAKEYFSILSKKVFQGIKKYIEKYALPQTAVQDKFKNATFDIRVWASSKTEKELEKELISSLEKGEVDGKFLYIMGGAEKFLKVMEAEKYQAANTEFKILKENLEEIARELPPNIFDLGSGDGSKAKLILEKQLEQKKTPEYHPMDISPSMIFNAAINTPPEVNVQGYIFDFNQPLEDKMPKNKNKGILFLGNTLGNGDLNYQKKLLNNISGVMQKDDKLLVGVQFNYDLKKIYKTYNIPQSIEFIKPMVRQLGIPDKDRKLFVSLDKEKSQISLNIKILNNTSAKIKDKKITLPAGKIIKLIVSHKYKIEEMDKLTQESKLKVEKKYQDKKNTYALFLLKK